MRDIGEPLLVAKPVERAEQIAEGVGGACDTGRRPGEDFLADPMVLVKSTDSAHSRRMSAPYSFHQVQRADRIARLLDIFMPFESMVKRGSAPLERRPAARPAAFEQRRLEPAAVRSEPSR